MAVLRTLAIERMCVPENVRFVRSFLSCLAFLKMRCTNLSRLLRLYEGSKQKGPDSECWHDTANAQIKKKIATFVCTNWDLLWKIKSTRNNLETCLVTYSGTAKHVRIQAVENNSVLRQSIDVGRFYLNTQACRLLRAWFHKAIRCATKPPAQNSVDYSPRSRVLAWKKIISLLLSANQIWGWLLLVYTDRDHQPW